MTPGEAGKRAHVNSINSALRQAKNAAPAAQSAGGIDIGKGVKDFLGNVVPQDNLFKQIGEKINKALK